MTEKGGKLFEGIHGTPVKTKLLQGSSIALICLQKLDQRGAFGPELMNCESSDVAHEEAKMLRWFGAYHTNIAQHMQDHGSYTFAPGVYNASVTNPLPTQLPPAVAAALSLSPTSGATSNYS